MDITEENRPLCKCHKYPKIWRTDKRKKSGGFWTCDLNRQISRRRWRLKDMRFRIVNKLEELENVK